MEPANYTPHYNPAHYPKNHNAERALKVSILTENANAPSYALTKCSIGIRMVRPETATLSRKQFKHVDTMKIPNRSSGEPRFVSSCSIWKAYRHIFEQPISKAISFSLTQQLRTQETHNQDGLSECSVRLRGRETGRGEQMLTNTGGASSASSSFQNLTFRKKISALPLGTSPRSASRPTPTPPLKISTRIPRKKDQHRLDEGG